jgi:hypothetical protein
MTSPYPHYLGESTVCAIEQAMTKVWTSLQASDPSVDWLKNGEVRTVLANRLMDLAEAGVTDANELSKGTLETLTLYLAAAEKRRIRLRRSPGQMNHVTGASPTKE